MPTLTPTYPIATARLHLRPFGDEDVADVHAFYSLPEVARFLYWEPHSGNLGPGYECERNEEI